APQLPVFPDFRARLERDVSRFPRATRRVVAGHRPPLPPSGGLESPTRARPASASLTAQSTTTAPPHRHPPPPRAAVSTSRYARPPTRASDPPRPASTASTPRALARPAAVAPSSVRRDCRTTS